MFPPPLLGYLAPFLFVQVMDQIDPPSRQGFMGEVFVRDAQHLADATYKLGCLPYARFHEDQR